MKAGARLDRAINPVARSLLLLVLCSLGITPHAIAFMSDRDTAEIEREAIATSATTPRFKIRGRVIDLVPGQKKSMRLKLVNDNPYSIRVSKLTVRAGDSGNPNCLSAALTIPRRKRVDVRVRAGRTAAVGYPVTLMATAPSECQLAQWPLRFKGEAVRVR